MSSLFSPHDSRLDLRFVTTKQVFVALLFCFVCVVPLCIKVQIRIEKGTFPFSRFCKEKVT